MKVLRQLQELCIALIVLHTGAEITLTVITSQETLLINDLSVEIDFECGSRVTFMCETKPYIDTAEWQVNSTIYAACYSILCFNYPPYPAYHEFSMSLATETFNLTTDPITLAARRSVYSCSNGLTALSVDAIVKVYVKNDTLEMDTSTANQITLTTGCVYPYGKDDLTFKWFISKDRVILEQSQFVRDKVQSITDFACSETSDCAGAETVQFNSTMVVDIFETGDEYHICVTVQHIDEPNRPPAVHCSVKTYRVSSYITDGSAKTYAYWIMFLTSLGIPRLIFFQKFIFLLGEVDRSNIWFSLAGCIFPALAIFLCIFKTDVCCCYVKICMKWINYVLSVVVSAIDIGIIVVFLDSDLEQLTQGRIYLPVTISYICVSWIMSAAIVICIYARSNCQQLLCAEKTDYICKSCKLNYCKDCVTYPQMVRVYIKCKTCGQKSVSICTLCNRQYCDDCVRHDRCNTEQRMTCVNIKCTKCIKRSVFICKLCKNQYCDDCVRQDRCITEQRMTCVCIKCTRCEKQSVSKCTLCNKQYCEDCVRHDRCKTEQHMTCGSCKKAVMEIKSYCCKCKQFLCNNCSKGHVCKGILLKHQQHDARSKEDILCELQHTTSYSACGFCLNCDCYVCFTCLKSHEEQQHILIQHNSGNTYECKKCRKDGNRFPVECVDLDSFTISCAECFEEKDQAEVVSLEDYNTLAKEQIHNLSKKNGENFCQIHEVPFSDQNSKVKSNVYCLICKAYMCYICYKNHRRLESVWLENVKWKRIKFDGFRRTDIGSIWIIFTLFPVVGIIFRIVQRCRYIHSSKVGQERRNKIP